MQDGVLGKSAADAEAALSQLLLCNVGPLILAEVLDWCDELFVS